MTFQIYTVDTPEYLRRILPQFRGDRLLTSQELPGVAADIAISISERRSRHLLQIWFVLGFLDRRREDGAFLYRLSGFGESLLNNLSFNESLAIELAHFAWYSAWLRSPDFERAWSWLYQDVCNLLWETSPEEVATNHITAVAGERAIAQYPDRTSAIDSGSISSVLAWLAELDPPFVARDESVPDRATARRSCKRERCNPELVHLAIQLQYVAKKLSFGTPLLMDSQLIESVCKACLLDPQQFWPMAEISALTFSTLDRKETAYGTSLLISEPADFTPPEPRALKPGSE